MHNECQHTSLQFQCDVGFPSISRLVDGDAFNRQETVNRVTAFALLCSHKKGSDSCSVSQGLPLQHFWNSFSSFLYLPAPCTWLIEFSLSEIYSVSMNRKCHRFYSMKPLFQLNVCWKEIGVIWTCPERIIGNRIIRRIKGIGPCDTP